jgi:glutathione S-transferase
MKLHWSPSAPFVRKVMICAEELGLSDRITRVRSGVGPTRLNAELRADNPLNKIPALVLDSGEALYDSRVICEYLDHLAGGGRLFPMDASERFKALRRQVLADGLLDVAILKRDEDCRGPRHQSPSHQQAFAAKIEGALNAMEADAEDVICSPYGIGHIAFGCALTYFDFRFEAYDWRKGRPRLARWCETFIARPASIAQPFVGEPAKIFPMYKFPGDDVADSK